MSRFSLRPVVAPSLALVLALGAQHALAQDAGKAPASSTTSRPATTTPPRPSSSTSSSARKILPDPALLDGSTQAADKKNEYGMLGDFELPGDDSSRSMKVGQQQPQNQSAASSGGTRGQQGSSGSGGQSSGSAGAAGAAAAAGAGGGAEAQASQNTPGGGGDMAATDRAQPAGGSTAKPDGVQVAGLSGEADANPEGQIASRPQAVAIGDKAMQIKTAPNAAGAIGGMVNSGQTQQTNIAVGAGKTGTSNNNGNRGAEKGRAMPAGL